MSEYWNEARKTIEELRDELAVSAPLHVSRSR